MASQIKLEIDTGTGDTALAANCGPINPNHEPLFSIVFGGQSIYDLSGQNAQDAVGEYLDAGITALRDRNQFQSLTVIEQSYRPQVLDFCVNLRDKCRQHPNCTIYIIP